ncbi:MAG TPA: PEGA domain-containing protein, partial [Opitutaceae bacterium]|nr:PEGA domain-containing protein [Opitutaceae bacterium]
VPGCRGSGRVVAMTRTPSGQPHAAPLADIRGGIIVRTEPTGAEVRVGAVAVEPSRLTLKEQKPGRSPVHIRLARYDDWDGEVEVKQNEFAALDVTLVRSTGTLDLTTDPSGLAYEVKGEMTKEGMTPTAATARMRPGPSSRTVGACMICPEMSGNGVWTGKGRIRESR